MLSKKRARFEKAWRKIEAAAETGEPVEGSVIEVVKGGLILDLGVRGFLPASLVDIRRVHNLDEFKGQTLECKVIELNRSRNNVVLSRRAVLEEERKEVREQILGRLQPGMVVEGKISNIVDFGAFVDLEGIDGLIHISELSWSHVNHPSEVLSIGETVRVKVLDIDRDRQRISLGLKQTQEDPWQTVLNEYKPNDILEGKVTKVVAFGAFIEIVPGVEGLVHISELAEHHVETPSEVVQPGQETWVRILEIDEERRRISLERQARAAQRQPSAPRPDPAGAPAGQRAGAAEPESRGARPRPLRGGLRRAAPAEPAAEAPSAADPPPMAEAADPQPPAEQVVEETAAEDARGARHRCATDDAAGRRAAGPDEPTKPAEPRAVAAARRHSGRRPDRAIAAGKSEALAALERLGAATLSADAVVHELLGTERVRDVAGRALGRGRRSRRHRRPRPGRRDRLRAPEELRLARGHPPPAGRRAHRAPGATGWPTETPLAVRRGAAAVRDRHGGARSTRRSSSSPPTRCAPSAPGPAAPPSSRRARGASCSQEEKAERATYVVSNDGRARGARALSSLGVDGRGWRREDEPPMRRIRVIVILVVIGVAGALIAAEDRRRARRSWR